MFCANSSTPENLLKKKKDSGTVSTLFIMLHLKSGDEGGEGGGL